MSDKAELTDGVPRNAKGNTSTMDTASVTGTTTNVQDSSITGAATIGAEPIDKKQPWRDIVKQDEFAQPGFFKETPAVDGSNKIRLLQELDAKSR